MTRSQAIGIGALLIAAIGLLIGSASSADLPCADVLRMHGMLRKAAGACRFSAYNPAIVEQAHACFAILGDHRGATEIYAGAEQFENLLSGRSREAICATLVRTFPMVVRP